MEIARHMFLSMLLSVGCAESERNDETSDAGADAMHDAATEPRCPVEREHREAVEVLATATVMNMLHTVGGTHDVGAGADRAFGGVIPLTTVAALYTATVTDACTAASEPVESCDEPEEGQPSEPFTRCSTMHCKAKDVRVARVWLDGVPFTTAIDPGTGEVTVREFETAVTYDEADEADAITVEWEHFVDLTLPSGARVQTEAHGSGRVPAGEDESPSASVRLVVEGLSSKALEATLEAEGDAVVVEGTGKIGGKTVFTYDSRRADDRVAWSTDCGR